MALSVPIEHSTKALVMSTPVSATWVGVALFGRAAVPLVTLSTIAAWAETGASHAAAMTNASARLADLRLLERSGITPFRTTPHAMCRASAVTGDVRQSSQHSSSKGNLDRLSGSGQDEA